MAHAYQGIVHRSAAVAASLAGCVLLLAACGGSSSGAGSASVGNSTSASPSPSAAPGATFRTAAVPGLGRVLVDGRGRTVYLLTSGGHHNVPCSDANGCTKLWPDLPLPDGVSAAKAGPGVRGQLLKAMKRSDGETYPTYNGWLMYEYTGDTGPAQSNGQGIRSFGGIWYAITPAGTPITKSPTPSSSTGSGYSY